MRLALAVAAVITVGVGAATQPPADIVALAGRYAEAYVDAFSAVVSEEKQTQTLVRPDGRVRKTREITADFLLVKLRGTWPDVFRDVITVDGKPVRNREDRLKKLFLEHPKTAPEMARAIAEESGRYNIGNGRRGNSPLLPLIFLMPKVADGVRFAPYTPADGPPDALTFEEFRTPTVMRRGGGDKGNHDMPARGSFRIEPSTGRVLAAEVIGENPDSKISAKYTVRYAIDPKLEISVPVEVVERYWRPDRKDADVLEVRATYSSFRRFQVKTDEQIKK